MLWFYCLILLLFRQRIPALLSFSVMSKLSPLGRPYSPSYEIVSIPTMIVNAYPRDLVPQREYFLHHIAYWYGYYRERYYTVWWDGYRRCDAGA